MSIAYGNGDTVRIPRFYWEAGSGGIVRIEWAGGSAIGQAALLAMPSPDIAGTPFADHLSGGAFAEQLFGDAGDDVLLGLHGNDTLDGGAGADLLDGGPGDDLLMGGTGNDSYRLAVGSGSDIVIEPGGDSPNTIALGAGLTPGDVSVVQRGNDLEVGLLGLGDTLLLRDAAAHADDWLLAGSHGTASTLGLRLGEQAATDEASMDAVRNAAWRAVHAKWAADLGQQGLVLEADDRWSRTQSQPIHVTLVRTNDAVSRGFEHLDGSIDGGTGIVPRPGDWSVERRTAATPQIFHNTGSIEREVIQAEAATIVRAGPGAQSTQTTTYRQVAMDWDVRWDGTMVTRSSTRSAWLTLGDGGPGSSNTGGPPQVLKGWFLTTDVHREAAGVATGTIGAFVADPPPASSDAEPEHLLAAIIARNTIYRYTETLGDDAGNRIEGGYFATGGGGNDVILNARVAYGGDGDDDLEGGEVLFGGNGDDYLRLYGVAQVAPYTHAHGGDGNDWLTGGDRLYGDAGNDTLGGATLLDGGDGDDRLAGGATLIGGRGTEVLIGGRGSDVLTGAAGGSVFRFYAGEPGADQVFAPGVGSTTVLDRFYRSRGFPLWEYQQQYPGSYIALTDGSPVVADDPFDGAIWMGPLPPPPPIPAANDFTGMAWLVSEGLVPADTAEFGPGIAPEQLTWSWSTRLLTDPFGTTGQAPARYAVLTAQLAPGQSVDFILPRGDSPLGSGVERFRFAGGTEIGMAGLLATLPVFDLDPSDGPLTLTGTAGPDTLRGLRDNDVLLGLAGADTLDGGAGGDLLDGGPGIDQLIGGEGDDTYILDDKGDMVIETGGGGWDLVRSSVGLTLPAFAEGLELMPGATSGRGNALANHLVGSGGNDTLWGGGGSDILQGGNGRDTLAGTGALPGRIVVSATAAGAPSALILGQIRVDGMHQRSFLVRSGRESTVVADLNADPGIAHQIDVVFVGSIGSGAAADRALLVHELTLGGIAVPLSGNGATFDPGRGRAAFDGVGVTATQGVLAGPGALRLTAAPTESSNDLLDGGPGDDTLVAGAGNDLVAGGPGNDRLTLHDGNDVIAFDRGDGTDSVFLASGATPTLSLGGGIGIGDIVLSRDRDTLIVDTGAAADRIRFANWYARGLAQREVKLQLIDPGSIGGAGGVAGATARVFDFDAVVGVFDAATAASVTAGGWRAAHALLHDGSGETLGDAVIGGAPAMHYALQRGFGGLGMDAVQATLNAPAFGNSAQAAGTGGSGSDLQRRLF